MPSTLTGLLLFIVLLVPGFAYLVGKERAGTERRTSPFRETVSIVAASVVTELVIFVISAVIWAWFIDFERLLTDAEDYWKSAPILLLIWGLTILAISTALAYVATLRYFRRLTWLPNRLVNARWFRPVIRHVSVYPHSSTMSAWWLMFDVYRAEDDVYVGVVLEDGSYLHGKLDSFNNNADDTSDRDLVLRAPIHYREPDSKAVLPWRCGAASVSARRIVTLSVAYVPKGTQSSPAASASVGGGG